VRRLDFPAWCEERLGFTGHAVGCSMNNIVRARDPTIGRQVTEPKDSPLSMTSKTSKNITQLVRRLGIAWPRRLLLCVFVLVGVVGAIQIASVPRCPNGNCPGSSKASGPAQVTITPGSNARDVDPVAHVAAKADSGTLTDVRMVNDAGKPVEGIMTPDNTVWKPTVPLGYGRTYTLRVTSRGSNGVASSQVSSFSTLQPSNQTKVSFTTTSEAALREGAPTASERLSSPTSTSRSPTALPPSDS
jgi:hypothetical protein